MTDRCRYSGKIPPSMPQKADYRQLLCDEHPVAVRSVLLPGQYIMMSRSGEYLTTLGLQTEVQKERTRQVPCVAPKYGPTS